MRVSVVILLLVVFPFTPSHAGGGLKQTLTAVPGNPVAPEFALTDTNGKVHRLSDYRGKVVIVNFWATWCPPCREEMPSMQRAWEQLRGEGIMLFAVNVGEDEEAISIFTLEYPVDFPLLMDRDSTVIRRWSVLGLPTTFVIDPEGRIAYRAIGGRAWDDPELLAPVRALRR